MFSLPKPVISPSSLKCFCSSLSTALRIKTRLLAVTLSPRASTKPSTFRLLSLSFSWAPSSPSLQFLIFSTSFSPPGPTHAGPSAKKLLILCLPSPVLAWLHSLKGVRHLILWAPHRLSVLLSYRIQYLLACVFSLSLHCLREGILSVCSTRLTQHLTASLGMQQVLQ